MQILKKILFPISILLIIALSFFTFFPVFSLTLNSDLAVHVLMTESLHFPEDFYYWGQDRLGSFLPILAHGIYLLLPVKSITAITIVHFTLMISIWWFLQRLLKNPFSKFILVLVLFIPFPLMLEQIYIGHPYASQFFAITLVVFFHEVILKKTLLLPFQKFISYIVISLFLMISVWISEVSVFFVFLFIIYSLFSAIQYVSSGHEAINFQLKINKRSTLVYTLIMLITFYYGFKFILYAKSFCYKQPGIEIWFTDYKTFYNMLDLFWMNFRDSVEFRINNIYLSVHNFAFLIISVFLTVHTFITFRKHKKSPPRLAVFFLLNAVLSFFFLMFSNWVAINNYGFRYFIYPYLFLVLSVIFYLDNLSFKTKLILQGVYLIGIIFYSILTFQHVKKYYKKDPRNFSLNRASKFTPLKNAGVIGDYWYSYVLALNSDMNIHATPYDKQYIRSPRMVDSVFLKKNIYLIKNDWFDGFPDTVKQFGLDLIKTGSAQSISSVIFCKYQLADLHAAYYPKNTEDHKGILVSERSNLVFETDSTREYNQDFIIYGPFTKLPPGKYKVSFNLTYSKTFPQNGKIAFDVSENWGVSAFAFNIRKFENEIIPSGKLANDLIFEITQIKNIVEYRIRVTGKFRFYVDYIRIDKIN